MVEQLAPCIVPWCKGKARAVEVPGPLWIIECEDCLASTDTLDTEAEAAELWNSRPVEAERDTLRSQIDAFWKALESSWDIEPRQYFEAEIAKGIGFDDSALAMAVHHMWKREVKR